MNLNAPDEYRELIQQVLETRRQGETLLGKPSMAQSWQTTNHQKSRFLANTCECVVEKPRHAGLETCDTAGWEACATTLECR